MAELVVFGLDLILVNPCRIGAEDLILERAIARPELTVTLVESDQRKAAFLKEAIRSIPNVRVISKRAESASTTTR